MIKKLLKQLYRRITVGKRYSSETYTKYLKFLSVQIGERTTIFDHEHTIIDVTRPWFVKIGNDVQITSGVNILTHG